MKKVIVVLFLLALVAGLLVLVLKIGRGATPTATAATGPQSVATIFFRHYVPAEELRPAAEVGGIPELIAWDLNVPLESILAANGLKPGQAVGAGATLVVPMPVGHQWEACASYYDTGQWNADGTRFDPDGISIASKELPKGSFVTITFLDTGVPPIEHVRVRDSGPYYATCAKYPGLPRAVDLSRGLMREGGVPLGQGLTRVIIALESIPSS